MGVGEENLKVGGGRRKVKGGGRRKGKGGGDRRKGKGGERRKGKDGSFQHFRQFFSMTPAFQ